MIPKKVAALTKLSNELMRMSNPGAEAMMRQDFAVALGLAVDLATLRGSGSENQPLGIANTPDINTVILGDNGGLPNFDTFTDMEYEVSVNNALRGNLGFVFHPAIRRLLKKLKIDQFSSDTSGEYVIAPFSDAQLEAYLGYKFGMTTQTPVNLKKGDATNCTELYLRQLGGSAHRPVAGVRNPGLQRGGDRLRQRPDLGAHHLPGGHRPAPCGQHVPVQRRQDRGLT